MQWTNFDPQMIAPATKPIYVSLDSRGQFYLNNAALEELGDPVAVRLMFDKEAGLIGIAASPLKAKSAIELQSRYAGATRGRTFSARLFCRHLGITPEKIIQFTDVKFENGVLIININSTTRALRGSSPIAQRDDRRPHNPNLGAERIENQNSL